MIIVLFLFDFPSVDCTWAYGSINDHAHKFRMGKIKAIGIGRIMDMWERFSLWPLRLFIGNRIVKI